MRACTVALGWLPRPGPRPSPNSSPNPYPNPCPNPNPNPSQLVSVFDIYTGATLLKMQRDGRVRCVALSNDGSVLVVGGFDRKVSLHLPYISPVSHLYLPYISPPAASTVR